MSGGCTSIAHFSVAFSGIPARVVLVSLLVIIRLPKSYLRMFLATVSSSSWARALNHVGINGISVLPLDL